MDSPVWRRLRAGLLVCVACALAGGGAAGAGWWRERGAAQAFAGAEAQLVKARGRYLALAGERREWRRFGPLFRDLQARGRIGEERPARWIEGARAAAARIPDAKHRLGVPRTDAGGGPVAVRTADMSVDLDLRHEGELPAFFAELERRTGGLFDVSGCRLARIRERSTPAPALDPSPAAISASCRLRWRTVVLSGVEPGWSPAAVAAADGAGDGDGDGPPGVRAESVLAEPSAGTFGRLFTTPAERARLVSAVAVREAAVPAPAPEVRPARQAPPHRPRWIHVNGMIARSGRPVVAWVDGERAAYHGLHSGRGRVAGDAPAGVRLDAGGRTITVRPGQRLDPATGEIADVLRGQPEGRLERDEFLRESSRPPLTPAPVPGLD